MSGLSVFQDTPECLKNQIYGSDGTAIQPIKTDANGHVYIVTESTNPVAVNAIGLDIRSLRSPQDSITVYGYNETDLTYKPLKLDSDDNLLVSFSASSTFGSVDFPVVNTATEYAFTAAQDVSENTSYSFFIINTGPASAKVKIQLCPVANDEDWWVDDGQEYTLGGNNKIILVANKLLKFVRVGYKSATANSTELTMVYQYKK